MKLIRRFEIKYFRSIYSASLKQCGSLNVLSGRNDVGKSNVLRALNLFFNGQTDWKTPLDFGRDFSLSRREQVRKESVKGKQFVQVSIEFERPDNFKGSLPERFVVKRNWYRDQNQFGQTDNLVPLEKSGKCPSTLATAQRMLPVFLNRVHFEYVPAVKERAFFDHILSRLQHSLLGVVLDTENPISQLSVQLAEHIGQQVGNLRDDFSRATSLDTSIEPPQQLSSLFQAFQVSVPSGENQVSLNLRGDGMQARYIPSVLHYIASKSSSFFIWGFEEPENSLEFSSADSLATDLENLYSKDAQIFITSYSPAMVSRTGAGVSCYRVWQPIDRTEVEWLEKPLGKSISGARLQEEIGLLRIQQEIHSEYTEKLRKLEALSQRVADLEGEIAANQLPLVLVEGVTDVAIFETAWTKLYPGVKMPFLVRSADPLANVAGGGSGGASSLAKAIESIHPADNRYVVAVFDHDQEGIKMFDGLSKNFKASAGHTYEKNHANGYAFAITLAVAGEELPTVSAKNLCVEYLFDNDDLALRNEDGYGLQLKEQELFVGAGVNKLVLSAEQKLLCAGAVGDLSAYRIVSGGKKVFAEDIVPTLESDKFYRFKGIFARIAKALRVDA
jgi:hypothetical protein